MAIMQRQLGELAQEALQAQQAYDELLTALREVLAGKISPEAKIALLGHLSCQQPVVTAPHSKAALEYIGRTSKRNEKRAKMAREARQKGTAR